ncbi:pyrroline-5-carboxylate reductase [Pelistega ratti]|uniref:pyrroline-5-carboxylate reductase n=1 Tax=Pelistega ratti TaxID=2652177 RepID=UPI00135CAD53|nr:pyrroline-5-carboxylate reductase [Pelistega ratti]
MSQTTKIAFIGGGNMARALGEGILASTSPQSLVVLERYEQAAQVWRDLGVDVLTTPNEQLSACHVWIYAVKPQDMQQVVQATKPYLQSDTLVISIAAGLEVATLEKWLNHSYIIRTMPNTPAFVRKGCTGLYATPAVKQSDVILAKSLLQSVGIVTQVEQEALLDAITGLSGSGPAYVFLFIEALIEGGIKLGLAPEEAKALAIQTVLGAAILADQSDVEPAQLRQNVTSKGGTTAAALDYFKQQEFEEIVAQAMQAATLRAKELSTQLSKAS